VGGGEGEEASKTGENNEWGGRAEEKSRAASGNAPLRDLSKREKGHKRRMARSRKGGKVLNLGVNTGPRRTRRVRSAHLQERIRINAYGESD